LNTGELISNQITQPYLDKCGNLEMLKNRIMQKMVRERKRIIHNKIGIHNSMAIPPAGDNLRLAKVGTILRAVPNYMKREYYTDVAIQAENEGQNPFDRYGRIVLIISMNTSKLDSNEINEEEICYIKYYKIFKNVTSSGMLILEWESENEIFGIVNANCILRQVHIIKPKKEEDKFILNRHKYW
jgi:hypothetical protein